MLEEWEEIWECPRCSRDTGKFSLANVEVHHYTVDGVEYVLLVTKCKRCGYVEERKIPVYELEKDLMHERGLEALME